MESGKTKRGSAWWAAAGCAALVLCPLRPAPASAQWAQFGGPDRNFTARAQGLADAWPEKGPKELWSRDLGDGYGTILVDGGTLFAMYRVDQDEFSVALDASSGATLWEHKIASPTTSLMEQYGAGPSSTPLLVGDRLFTIGTNMVMHCFEKKSGKVLWQHDLVKELGASVPGRGYSASPIAYKDAIILPVGGKGTKGQSVVAFDESTGSVLWKNQSFDVTHSSPILIQFAGEDQLVMFMGGELVGLNPNDGELLWSHAHKTQYGANLSTPLWNGKDLIFGSAAYGSGARVIRLERKGDRTVPTELWHSKKMRVHHANVVGIGEYVYGSSGDFGPALFMGIHMATGKIAWRQRGFKKATCVYGDGKLIILDEDGQLALATVTPDGLTVHSKCTVAETYAWAAPTLVGRTLYIRDRKHIIALDVG
ncbi:MAG: PQQ-binding-like beta-propeller repeat protein [Phycisphaerae bacterium]